MWFPLVHIAHFNWVVSLRLFCALAQVKEPALSYLGFNKIYYYIKGDTSIAWVISDGTLETYHRAFPACLPGPGWVAALFGPSALYIMEPGLLDTYTRTPGGSLQSIHRLIYLFV